MNTPENEPQTVASAEKTGVFAEPSSTDPTLAPTPETNPLQATGDLKVDAQNDVTQAITQARTAAKAEVDAAATAIGKFMSTAAGDVPVLLTDAESASVPLLLSKVPGAFQAVVGGFVQGALSGSESTANALANTEVAKGLAFAEAEIYSLQKHLDELL